jgi:FkbM family methyltransferase
MFTRIKFHLLEGLNKIGVNIVKINSGLGYKIILIRDFNNNLKKHLKNILELKNIDCILDVGANTGQYGKYIRGLGFSGHIFSFEPCNVSYKKLIEASAKDEKWHVFQCGLGDSTSTMAMNVFPENSVFSSLLKVKKGGLLETKYNLNDFEVYSEDVDVFRMDEIMPSKIEEFGFKRIFLKMDTQGYDSYVFKGAKGILKNIVSIQSEISLIEVYDDMMNYHDSLKLYEENSFLVSGLYPVSRDEKSLAIIEYDCIMVRY